MSIAADVHHPRHCVLLKMLLMHQVDSTHTVISITDGLRRGQQYKNHDVLHEQGCTNSVFGIASAEMIGQRCGVV